jgi:hypothetical protein
MQSNAARKTGKKNACRVIRQASSSVVQKGQQFESIDAVHRECLHDGLDALLKRELVEAVGSQLLGLRRRQIPDTLLHHGWQRYVDFWHVVSLHCAAAEPQRPGVLGTDQPVNPPPAVRCSAHH